MNTMNPLKIIGIAVASILIMLGPWPGIQAREPRVKFEHVLNTGVEIRGNPVIQDRQGFIWIGTHNGLARYDGYDLKWFKKTGKAGFSNSSFPLPKQFFASETAIKNSICKPTKSDDLDQDSRHIILGVQIVGRIDQGTRLFKQIRRLGQDVCNHVPFDVSQKNG